MSEADSGPARMFNLQYLSIKSCLYQAHNLTTKTMKTTTTKHTMNDESQGINIREMSWFSCPSITDDIRMSFVIIT
eukprot:g3888.t1